MFRIWKRRERLERNIPTLSERKICTCRLLFAFGAAAAVALVAIYSVLFTANHQALAADGNNIEIGESVDSDVAYISKLSMSGKSTGSEPFDDDNTPGNDSSADNDIVRSFDEMSYEIEYVITPYDDAPYQYYRYSRVGFRFIIDNADSNIVDFDTDSMLWMDSTNGYEYEVSTETIDEKEYRVLTCYRRLIPTSEVPTTVPSTGTVNLMMKTGAAKNGERIHVSVESWVEHNDIDGDCDIHGRNEKQTLVLPELTVSAAPRYNVALLPAKTDNLYGHGDYDFSLGGENAPNKDAGVVNGRIYLYGVTLQLYNSSAEKRLKGIEVPTGKITLQLELDSKFVTDGTQEHDVTDSYTPIVWSVTGNNADGDNTGTMSGRPETVCGQFDHTYASYAGPFNSSVGSIDSGAVSGVYDGGEWEGSQSGNIITLEVDGYSFDYDAFPDTTAGRSADDNDHLYYNGPEVANIGCFSCAEVWVVQPYYNKETGEYCLDEFDGVTGDFTITISDSHLAATSVSGVETTSEDTSNQMCETDDRAAQTQNLRQDGSFDTRIYYSFVGNDGTNLVGTDNGTYLTNGADGTDSALPGSNLTLVSSTDAFVRNTDEFIGFALHLIKFDNSSIEYDQSRQIGGDGFSLMFMTKPDGTGWENDDEQKNATIDDLVVHEAYDEIVDAGETCVAILAIHEPDWHDTYTRYLEGVAIPITLKGEAEIGHVAMATNEVRAWTYSDIARELGISSDEVTADVLSDYIDDVIKNDVVGYDVIPSLTTHYGPRYTKSVYDESGYVGGHVGGASYGDSLLAVGEKLKIQKETAQRSDGEPKSIYDLDYSQRYVDYALYSSFDTSDSPSLQPDRTTVVTITDTLPASLTYVPMSSYFGGTYTENNGGQEAGTISGGTQLEPSATHNDDGTTTLVWQIRDIEYGAQIDPIHFSCMIGTPGDEDTDVSNNQQIVNDVEIGSTYDNRVKRVELGNKTSSTIIVSKLRSQALTISPDPMLSDVSSSIGFTTTIGNYSAQSRQGFAINIMPYVGEGSRSSFSGSYTMPTMNVTDTDDNLSQLTFYATTDTAIRSSNLIGLEPDDVIGTASWVECEFDPETGIVTLPNGGSGITAWYILDESLSPNERINVTTPLIPIGNEANDVYTSRWSDGDNIVNASIYIVARTVSGRVFIDSDGNDRYTDGDELVSGAVVRLVDGSGATVISLSGEPLNAVTDDNGTYEFINVPAGEFSIEFSPENDGDWQYLSAATPNADDVSDDIDSDAIASLDDDGALIGARIDSIEMPSIDEMVTALYSSEHNDLGLRSNGTANLSVEKTALVEHQTGCRDDGDAAHYGDVIAYSIVVTNTGDVPLYDVAISDAMLDLDALVIVDELIPGGTASYEQGRHVVTTDDLVTGSVTNKVSAHGTPPEHVAPPNDPTDKVETPITQNPAIMLEKSVDISSIDDAVVGDILTYSFVVTNIGDVPVSDLDISDYLNGLSPISFDWSTSTSEMTGNGTLASKETVIATATYSVTQEDIDAGFVKNVAVASAKTPSGNGIDSNEDDAITELRAPDVPDNSNGNVNTGTEDDINSNSGSSDNNENRNADAYEPDNIAVGNVSPNLNNTCIAAEEVISEDTFSNNGSVESPSYDTAIVSTGESGRVIASIAIAVSIIVTVIAAAGIAYSNRRDDSYK